MPLTDVSAGQNIRGPYVTDENGERKEADNFVTDGSVVCTFASEQGRAVVIREGLAVTVDLIGNVQDHWEEVPEDEGSDGRLTREQWEAENSERVGAPTGATVPPVDPSVAAQSQDVPSHPTGTTTQGS